jgi:hypothetical protein
MIPVVRVEIARCAKPLLVDPPERQRSESIVPISAMYVPHALHDAAWMQSSGWVGEQLLVKALSRKYR